MPNNNLLSKTERVTSEAWTSTRPALPWCDAARRKLMRFPLSLLLVALSAVSMASTENTSRQAVFADLTQIANPAVWNNNYNTSVLGTAAVDGQSTASVVFNGFRSAVGQALTSPMDWSPYNIVTFKFTNY